MVLHGMKMIYEHMPCHCAISCHFLVELEDIVRPNLRLRTGRVGLNIFIRSQKAGALVAVVERLFVITNN